LQMPVAVLHASHTPLQGVSQHTPDEQLLLAHCSPVVQLEPRVAFGTLQSPPALHSDVALHVCPILIAVKVQTASGVPQLPLRQRLVVTVPG
jgi:hypothetical protein